VVVETNMKSWKMVCVTVDRKISYIQGGCFL